jgi:hypothetical protein
VNKVSHSCQPVTPVHVCIPEKMADAFKSVAEPFSGDKRKLKEFCENVDAAFGLINPDKYLFYKYVRTRIKACTHLTNQRQPTNSLALMGYMWTECLIECMTPNTFVGLGRSSPPGRSEHIKGSWLAGVDKCVLGVQPSASSRER